MHAKRFHICETALLRVHNDLLRAVDNRCCVVLLLPYLSTAFDTVDHNLLLTVDSNLSMQFVVKHCSGSNPIFRNVLSCYASTRRNLYLTNWFAAYPKAPRSAQSSNFSTHHLWLTFSDVTIWLLIFTPTTLSSILFFSCNYDLGLHCTTSNVEKCLSGIDLWMTADKLKSNKDGIDLFLFQIQSSDVFYSTSFLRWSRPALLTRQRHCCYFWLYPSTVP